MTAEVSVEEGPVTQDEKRQSRAERSRESRAERSRERARKRRSLQSMVRRLLRPLTKPRIFLRVAAISLPLLGFVYVSISNGVLTSNSDSGSSAAAPTMASLPVARAVAGDTPAPAMATGVVVTASDTGRAAGVVRTVSSLGSSDPASSDSDMQQLHALASDTVSPGTTASTGPQSYPVNEGGSLWRTGKHFLPDEVVLDRLIDNLAASGMDVRRVFPGAEFLVETVSDGHLVVRIDHGRQSYVSRIIDGRVSTTVHRPVTVAIKSSFLSDASSVGLEEGVLSEIVARDEDMSLGVESAQPGDRVRFELRETREFGSPEKTTDVVWIEKNGERLWRETSNFDTLTVALSEQ